jgi:hypothetical protein
MASLELGVCCGIPRSRSLAVAALTLQGAAAFTPAGPRAGLLKGRTSVARPVLQENNVVTAASPASDKLNLDASVAAVPVALTGAGTSEFDNLKVSKFKPRARETWDPLAGYGRYANDEDSQVYGILKVNPATTCFGSRQPHCYPCCM